MRLVYLTMPVILDGFNLVSKSGKHSAHTAVLHWVNHCQKVTRLLSSNICNYSVQFGYQDLVSSVAYFLSTGIFDHIEPVCIC